MGDLCEMAKIEKSMLVFDAPVDAWKAGAGVLSKVILTRLGSCCEVLEHRHL